MSRAKTDKTVNMSFGLWTCGGSRNHAFGVARYPSHEKRHFGGHSWAWPGCRHSTGLLSHLHYTHGAAAILVCLNLLNFSFYRLEQQQLLDAVQLLLQPFPQRLQNGNSCAMYRSDGFTVYSTLEQSTQSVGAALR